MSKILNHQLQEFRFRMMEIVKDLHQMTIDIGNKDLSEMVSDLRNRINEPFMFVIVGEVKVGKSSFTNALLDAGKEICKVAPDPCTDTIQQILYGEEENEVVINDYLKKIFQPIEILKEIAIVDTPGTNTIEKHHQEITERFIPGSDLVVFVFEAKNPYRQSAWNFFDFIHKDWQKKIIFILQQADLMDPNDLFTNINGTRKYAEKKGIKDPKIFAVSAKMELEGNRKASGFKAVRDYIANNITGGKAPLLKLNNNIHTSENINNRIERGLIALAKQHQADVAFRTDITQTLDVQEGKSNYQVGILVENLLAGYDKYTRITGQELNEGLNFFSLARRSFASLFNKKKSPQVWLKKLATDLEDNLNKSLTEKLNHGVNDIATSIQQMAKLIDLKIRNSETNLKNNQLIFSDLNEKRSSVLRELQAEFASFINHSENFVDASVFPNDPSFSPNIATGSGLAVIGVVLATVTQGMVFDITGGIISAIGFLFAGITISLKRRKVIEDYKKEIANGRTRLKNEITQRLGTYIKNIKGRIDANFRDFDTLLEIEEKKVKSFTERFKELKGRLVGVKKALGEGNFSS